MPEKINIIINEGIKTIKVANTIYAIFDINIWVLDNGDVIQNIIWPLLISFINVWFIKRIIKILKKIIPGPWNNVILVI